MVGSRHLASWTTEKEKAGGSAPPVGSQFNRTVSLHRLRGLFSLEMR